MLKNSTGSSSRIAAFNKPFASYGVDGITIFKPGVPAKAPLQTANDRALHESRRQMVLV